MRSLLFVPLGVLIVAVPVQAEPPPRPLGNQVKVSAAAFTPDGKQALTAYLADTPTG